MIAVGVVLRAAHVLAAARAPWFGQLQLDHRFYDAWAQRVADGEWFGNEAFFVDPLYAYFLALIYRLFGHHVLPVLLVQAVLGISTCYLTYLLGRRVLGVASGSIACGVVALFLPAIYYEGLIEKTALSVFLLTASLFFFLGRSTRQAAISGVALGLACLTRANLVLFVPLGALILHYRDRKDASREDSAAWLERWRRKRVLPFALGSLLVVLVPVVHNYRAAGVVSLTSSAGQNFYIGNHQANAEGSYQAPAFVRPDPAHEEADFAAEARRRTGRQLSASEVSSHWRKETLRELAKSPTESVLRLLKKLQLFWHDYEVPDNANPYLDRDDSFVLRLPLLTFGMVVPFAAIGAVALARRNANVRLLVGLLGIYCLTVVAFFVLGRFRMPVLPALAVLAEAGALSLTGVLRQRSPRKLLAYGVTVVLGLWLCLAMPDWLERVKRKSLAVAYNNRGKQLADTGLTRDALVKYERAVELDELAVVAARRAAAELLLEQGRYADAERHMLRVLQLKPDSGRAREALVRLYSAMLMDSAYRQDARVREKLAAAYDAAGRPRDAALLRNGRESSSENRGDDMPSGGALDAATIQKIGQALSVVPAGTSVWLAFAAEHANAPHIRSVREAFAVARWTIREQSLSFRVKAGLFLFIADNTVPDSASVIEKAFSTAGLRVPSRTDYRAYFDEMKRANPSWNGVAMSPEQPFALVIGSALPR